MKARAILLTPTLALAIWGSRWGWQHAGEGRSEVYEPEMQSPASEDPPDAWIEGEFAFARLRYRGYGRGYRRSSWGTDSNTAERHFMQGLRRLTRVDARSVEEIIDVDSDEVFK